MSYSDALVLHGGRWIGGLSDFSTSSFHPVKHITTGEGGGLADRLWTFRNHGIDREVRERQAIWRQDMVAFGSNYG